MLEKADYATIDWSYDERRVDYGKQFECKIPVLKKAFARFDRTKKDWLKFLKTGKYADYALFMTLKTEFGYAPWTEWAEPYKSSEGKGLESYIEAHREEIEFWQFTQYIFLKQWNELHAYAKEKGIEIMGDMPIYVASDSVETWKYRRELFMLDGEGNPALKAGVPLLTCHLLYGGYVFAGTNVLISDFIRYFCVLCVITGHIYPVTFGFKGGKGIACTMGAFWFSLSCDNL